MTSILVCNDIAQIFDLYPLNLYSHLIDYLVIHILMITLFSIKIIPSLYNILHPIDGFIITISVIALFY